MELRQLQYFIAVAEELHFGHAAIREKVAPSAVSEQIRRLERELGVSLLERTSRKVQLTEAGRLFVDEIRPTLQALSRAGELARRAGRGEFGKLRIGFVSTAAYELTTEILRQFHRQYPGISVDLHEFPLTDASAGVLDENADAAFVRLPLLPNDKLTVTPLLTEPCALAVAKDHPLAGRASIDLPAIERDPRLPTLISMATGGITVRGDRRGNPAPAMRTVGEVLEAFVMGTAIGLVPRSYARGYQRPGIKYVPLTNAPQSQVGLVWRTQPEHPTLTPFVALCQRMAKEANARNAAPAARTVREPVSTAALAVSPDNRLDLRTPSLSISE